MCGLCVHHVLCNESIHHDSSSFENKANDIKNAYGSKTKSEVKLWKRFSCGGSQCTFFKTLIPLTE